MKSKSLGRKFKKLTPSRTKISAIGSQEETSQLADETVNDPATAGIEMEAKYCQPVFHDKAEAGLYLLCGLIMNRLR